MDDVWLVLLQLLLVGTILGTLLTYLLRGLMCRATVEVGTKSVLITGCDTGYENYFFLDYNELLINLFHNQIFDTHARLITYFGNFVFGFIVTLVA